MGLTGNTPSDANKCLSEYENNFAIMSYALNDQSSRNESFNETTEPQKVNQFIKCYDVLDSNCFDKFNETYRDYFGQHKNEMDDFTKFILTKMSQIDEVIYNFDKF